MEAAAVNLHRLGFHFRHILLTTGGNAPDPNLTVFINSRHILAGAGYIHHANRSVRQLYRKVCIQRIVLFISRVGHRAVLQQRDIGVVRNGNLLNIALVLTRLLVFAFFNPFFIPAVQLVSGGVTPEIHVTGCIQNDRKLVACLQLFDFQVAPAQGHIQLGIALILVLTQTRVTPEIKIIFCINCNRMIAAGGQKCDVYAAVRQLCGNVLHVNGVADSGIAPGVNLSCVA